MRTIFFLLLTSISFAQEGTNKQQSETKPEVDKALLEEFKERIINAYTDSSEIKYLIVEHSAILENVKGEERKELEQDAEEMEKFFAKWNERTHQYIVERQGCETVTVTNIEAYIDRAGVELIGYMGSYIFTCDGTSTKVMFGAVGFGGKLYLLMIRDEV